MALKTRKNTKKENKKGCGSKSCKHYKHNYKNGKCNIPIRKLGILNEGTVGRIKLEVIAEGTVFVPWEDEFKVKVSKKVSVVVNENKRQSSDSKKSGVKVNFKK